jgi:hypothetical protein
MEKNKGTFLSRLFGGKDLDDRNHLRYLPEEEITHEYDDIFLRTRRDREYQNKNFQEEE